MARLPQETLSKILNRHPMSYYCSSAPLVCPLRSSSTEPRVSLMIQTYDASYIGNLPWFP